MATQMKKKKIVTSNVNSAAKKVFSETLSDSFFIMENWPVSNNAKKNTNKNYFRRFIYDSTLGCYFYNVFLVYIMAYRFKVKLEKNILMINERFKNEDIHCVIVSSDRTTGADLALSIWARSREIPIIIQEYAYPTSFEGAIKSRTEKIYRSFLSNSKSSRSGFRFYLPHEELVLKRLNCLPRNAWIDGTNYSDYIISGNSIHSEIYLNGGVDRSKVKTLGCVEYDNVLKHNININTKNRRKFIGSSTCIVSLPQYWEHNLCSKDRHFDEIKSLLSVLNNSFKKVYVSLHPKMSVLDYEDIIREHQCILLEKNLSSSMHLADFFIGTYSSTMLWAVLLNIPCVIVDHLKFNYQGFYPELDFDVVGSNKSLDDYLKKVSEINPNYNGFEYFSDYNSKNRINKFIYFLGEANENHS